MMFSGVKQILLQAFGTHTTGCVHSEPLRCIRIAFVCLWIGEQTRMWMHSGGRSLPIAHKYSAAAKQQAYACISFDAAV